MNLKEIKEMIQLMNENNLNEIEVEKEGLKIRLVRGVNGIVREAVERAADTYAVAPTASSPQTKPQPPAQEKEQGIAIKAPMVGTFYKASGPEASPYVEVGSKVNPGDVVCIIEAMKLMNEIKSEVKGRIKEVLVESGEPVEFGQTLFLIEPE